MTTTTTKTSAEFFNLTGLVWDSLTPAQRDAAITGLRIEGKHVLANKLEAVQQGMTTTTDTTADIKQRLEYLRGELRAERISYGELGELQGLAEYIDRDDLELLEAAGVPESNGEPSLTTQPSHTPTPWTLSSPMINQLLARETVPDSHYPVTGIDVPEGKGRLHYGGVIVLSEDPNRARFIVRAVNNHDKLVEALGSLLSAAATLNDALHAGLHPSVEQSVLRDAVNDAREVLAELGE